MIKRLLAVGAVLSILSLYGCSVDCEVCAEYMGIKSCETAKDVKKSECEDCDQANAADYEGMTVTCTAK